MQTISTSSSSAPATPGCEAAWAAARMGRSVGDLHALARHGRPHAVQSGGRRNSEGPPCSRDRRARRPDGAGDRRDRRSSSSCSIAAEGRRSGRRARRPTSAPTAAGFARRSSRVPNITWIIGPRRTDTRRRTDGSAVWRSRTARSIACDALVVTTGTFLNGLVHVGPEQRPSGRADEPPSRDLAESLKSFGFEWGRLKTGTPPRLHRRSIDFSRFVEERGDDPPVPFSFTTRIDRAPQISCYLVHTTDRVHDLVRRHIARVAALQRPDLRHRSALLSFARRQGRCGFPTGSGTRSSSSRKASTSTRFTSTAIR